MSLARVDTTAEQRGAIYEATISETLECRLPPKSSVNYFGLRRRSRKALRFTRNGSAASNSRAPIR